MKSGFWSTGSELFLADRQGEDSLKDSFLMLNDESCFEKDGFRRVLGNLWYPLKSLKSVCFQLTVMLRSVKRSHRKELSFCAKQSEVAESNCHSEWSETESQNLLENHRIVILREVKRSRRISPLSKHQHNSLKIVPPQLNFQPDFQVFLRTFKNPKQVFLQLIQWHQS